MLRLLNANFSNILVISLRSAFLMKETKVPGENHQPAASHWQTASHNVVSSTPLLTGIRIHNISGDRHRLHRYLYSNYHTITTTTDPKLIEDSQCIIIAYLIPIESKILIKSHDLEMYNSSIRMCSNHRILKYLS
jgi:hypothetical protein